MLKFSAKVFIAFIPVSNIYAQSKFEPGYIVTSSQDTIRGTIEYHNWSQNPETIRFRDEKFQTEKTLGLHELSAFQVHGETYERAEVHRKIQGDNNVTENGLPELTRDTVFLLRLVDGPKSLHYLRDRSDNVQLYIGPEHELLVYHKYKIIKENQNRIATVDRYRQQIKAYLDCESVANRVPNLRYSNKEISRLFELYYDKCSTTKPKVITKREGLGFESGALAGVTLSKLSFKGYHFEYLTERQHTTSVRPTVGLFLNIVIPRTNKNLIVANELTYSSYQISDRYQTNVNPENFTITDFTFGLSHLRLNNLIRYRITRGNAFLYGNVGISNGFVVSENNRYVATTHFYTDVHVDEDKALATRKHDQGFVIGIGAGIRKLGFEARFENSNGNSDYFSVTSNVKRVALHVYYRF